MWRQYGQQPLRTLRTSAHDGRRGLSETASQPGSGVSRVGSHVSQKERQTMRNEMKFIILGVNG